MPSAKTQHVDQVGCRELRGEPLPSSRPDRAVGRRLDGERDARRVEGERGRDEPLVAHFGVRGCRRRSSNRRGALRDSGRGALRSAAGSAHRGAAAEDQDQIGCAKRDSTRRLATRAIPRACPPELLEADHPGPLRASATAHAGRTVGRRLVRAARCRRKKQRPTIARGPEPKYFPATTYSPTHLAGSTIGAEGLNCRVRNGNGCFPLARVTGKLEFCKEPSERLELESICSDKIRRPARHINMVKPNDRLVRVS